MVWSGLQLYQAWCQFFLNNLLQSNYIQHDQGQINCSPNQFQSIFIQWQN